LPESVGGGTKDILDNVIFHYGESDVEDIDGCLVREIAMSPRFDLIINLIVHETTYLYPRLIILVDSMNASINRNVLTTNLPT
jgi:hypothetical protein